MSENSKSQHVSSQSHAASAIARDQQDAIAHLRDHYELPEDTIYLDGNSLGALPKAAKKRALEVVETQWGKDLITSWNKHAWIDLPINVGDRIAPLIGAKQDIKNDPTSAQVICCDSISVNLFKLLCASLSLNSDDGKRTKILSQRDNFPTDLYTVEGLQALIGAGKCELVLCEEEEIEQKIEELGDSLITVMLTHVNFRSGYIHNLPKVTELAHQHGALVIWDLAHSAGVLPVNVDEHKVDFAVGCGYKYLNGGPGAPAFVYAAKRHHAKLQQPLSGWMGHAKPFDFAVEYQADSGIKQFLSGTPSVISMSVLDAALSVFDDVSIQQIRDKSMALTSFFQQTVEEADDLKGLKFASPASPEQRGSQLAYTHDKAYALCQALISKGIVADFRAPNIIRFGFSPTYLSFQDIFQSIETLKQVMRDRTYELPQFNRKQAVT